MYALQRIVTKAPQCANFRIIQRGNRNPLVTGPRVKVSTLELWGHGLFLAFGILLVPAYVATNFKNYTKGS